MTSAMLERSHCLLLAVLLLPDASIPDEGQWLPTQVREMDWAALQQRGMALTKDEFWHPERGGVLSATVQINGCTASFVSADGLLLTNHHCGFGAVSELSTPTENHLRDGFAARDRASELPAKGMVASVLLRIEDVTATLHEAQAKAKDDLERWSITQNTIAKLVADGEAREPGTKCAVAPFLEGKEYHLYFRTQIRDVRLVYAPPRAIGEFGGEVDNWEWPRHTGDFTFFRAYVGKDGKVADHAADNVPYRPQHTLKVATGGVQAGDLAIIMGYPGRTQRYRTAGSIALQQGYVYPRRHAVLTSAIAVLERASKTDERLALAVADRIKSLANVQKNAAGMIFGLSRNGTVAQKQREEEEFAAWVAADGERSQRFADVLRDMHAIDAADAKTLEKDTMVWFLNALDEDLPLMSLLVEAAGASATDPEGKVPPRLLAALAQPEVTGHWDTVQLPLVQLLLAEFAAMSANQRLRGTEFAGGTKGLDEAAVAKAFAETKMLDAAARAELFAKGGDAITKSSDPLVVLAKGLASERLDNVQRQRQRAGRLLVAGRRWIEAQESFRGRAFYPDANSTLRVSIGTVEGYSPREAVTYTPHTTVAGLLQKETGKEPFANPRQLLKAAASRGDSRWVDKQLGDVPVCFLTSGDTTGGNSGSPVVNGKGELIGLNFDRVFENVVGDFAWNKDRSRNVVCDVRYILWVVESVCPSPSLLAELGA
jgi:hypothetical protein